LDEGIEGSILDEDTGFIGFNSASEDDPFEDYHDAFDDCVDPDLFN
jgi:hypothetical protein